MMSKEEIKENREFIDKLYETLPQDASDASEKAGKEVCIKLITPLSGNLETLLVWNAKKEIIQIWEKLSSSDDSWAWPTITEYDNRLINLRKEIENTPKSNLTWVEIPY